MNAPLPKAPEEALSRLLSAPRAEPAWFSPDFLAKVPPSVIDGVLKQLRDDIGAFVSVTVAADHSYVTRFARGTVPTRARIDAEGRFTTLFFGQPDIERADLDGALKALAALPGKRHVLVTTDGKDRIAEGADQPLAVGSAFKLAVLAALRGQVDARKRTWKDVITLDPEHRSLPSGLLQEWPAGSMLTLQSLAALMIARSDNTATDALISLLGRAAIEPLAPHARPFLTTRQTFVLKSKGGEALLGKWRKGDEVARRAMLAEIDKRPLPPVDAFPEGPTAIEDVEWDFSARELCALMDKVHDLPLFSINPGVARARDWERVAYKGGSEPGVLNLTTRVTGKGHTHCVVVTLNNDKPIDETRVFGIYGQMLSALRSQ